MTSRTIAKLADSVSDEIRELLGPPALISAESEVVYYATLAGFAEFVDPSDLITWFIIKDLADSRAEVTRYRKVKCDLMEQLLKARARERGEDDPNPADQVNPLDEILKLPMHEIRRTPSVDDATLKALIVKMHSQPAEASKPLPTSQACLEAIGSLEPLLIIAERRFHEASRELERRKKDLGKMIPNDVIEGEIIEERPLPPDRRRGTIASAWRPATRRALPDRKKSTAQVLRWAVTSINKKIANRRNARKSTGPRSAAGKLAASRNAIRHGLSSANLAKCYAGDVARIAGALCKDDTFSYRYNAAVDLAEAQVMINRIRLARVQFLTNPQLATSVDQAVLETSQALGRLDGYERKAICQRSRAARKFEALAD